MVVLAGLVSGPSRRGDPPARTTPAAAPVAPATELAEESDRPALPAADLPVSDVPASRGVAVAKSATEQSAVRLELPLEELCGRVGAKLSSVSTADCLGLGMSPSGGRSRDGSPIMIRDFAPGRSQSPLARVLVIGGIHGDEYSAVSIVFKWLRLLADDHDSPFHWRVVPLLNPDGLLRERAQRMNSRGVDLNRNFPNPDGHDQALDYWVRRAESNPRRYPGPAALREPESKWLADEIEAFRPQAIVAVHAPLEVVDFDGPVEPPARLGSLMLHRMGTYPGSLGRYAGEHMELPVVTIELPQAGVLPSAKEQAQIWQDLVRYLLENVPGSPPAEKTTTVARAVEHASGF